ncbi:hypothetical protein PFMALIP_05496 [Plasmodium falciparum MaliPS096_E11]|uniref:Peptidase A1 domain-containing protein n=1 Tax=Plasmodium falciparum MaliPS096_E11 TaxID=1036727 RepID=A0A024WHW7_PLAFA|nr:hypothetical protein PFMALIP_05496 [Plasmodium falciparum MaliPS096_E11]
MQKKKKKKKFLKIYGFHQKIVSQERVIINENMIIKFPRIINWLKKKILWKFYLEPGKYILLIVKNQEFGLASYISDDPFSDMQFDGLFGLGISDDKKKKQLIYDSIPKNILEKNMFAIYYPKNVDDDGAITFGGYDKKFIRENSSIEWFDVTSSKYWAIQMKGLKINDVFLDVCSKNHEGFCQAVIDTGTSSIAGPKEDLILLSRLLNPGKFCQKRILLKNFSFIFIDDKRREREYELTPKDYIVNSFRIDPVLRSPCNFAFMPINISSSNGYLYILGQIFLQKYYAIFEKDNMKIG